GVVIIENIVRRLHESAAAPDPVAEPATERIRRAVIEVARPTVMALLIIIAAYLPIFLLQRVEGRIFSPLAHTVVAALVGSLVFSVTLVPLLATFAYRRPRPHREPPVLLAASSLYLPALRAALRHPVAALLPHVGALRVALGVLARPLG